MADELALVAGAGITDESVDAVTQARATLIRRQAAEIVEAAGMRETLTLRQGCQCPRKLGWSRASGDSCRPVRLTRVCAAVIAEHDRRLAAAGGLEAVREATVHDMTQRLEAGQGSKSSGRATQPGTTPGPLQMMVLYVEGVNTRATSDSHRLPTRSAIEEQ
jgi:hypothetical protein